MIFGAPVGTLSCFAVISILNLLIIKRCVPNPPRYLVALSKPLAASVVMAAAAWGSHGLLARVLNGSLTRDMAATAGAILVGVVVYVILVLALRTLTREDLEMMPGGKKAGVSYHTPVIISFLIDGCFMHRASVTQLLSHGLYLTSSISHLNGKGLENQFILWYNCFQIGMYSQSKPEHIKNRHESEYALSYVPERNG